MDQHSKEISEALGRLAEDARALMSATAHVAGTRICDARHRLALAAERGRETLHRGQARAVAGARAADRRLHEHPYQGIALGLGIGALLGYLLAHRPSPGAGATNPVQPGGAGADIP